MSPLTLPGRLRPRLLAWLPKLLAWTLFAALSPDHTYAQQGGTTAPALPDEEEADARDKAKAAALEEVVVTGRPESRDEAGRNEVYAKDVSNVYAGKEEIERYKGTSVGDLFKGLNGVYSGDSRNSGALDPNIRGIQGEGRIPLTVDGTEQATSVWMGPAGIANRNYLDPNLIGSIMVEKGPSMTPGLKSGIGGAVQVRTLDVDDIVEPGESFGIEVKGETASNSVKPDDRMSSYFGQDYRDLPGAIAGTFGDIGFGADQGPGAIPRKGSSGTDFDFADKAFRLAMAKKHEYFDVLAAYSYRKRGNYYSGKNGAGDYRQDKWWEKAEAEYEQGGGKVEPRTYIGSIFQPGNEVPNTSSELESILLKGSVYLPDGQSLKLSLMRTDHEFGESVPWLVSWAMYYKDQVKNLQYPLSELKQDTYALNYAWKPDANPWIDFKANVWTTQSDSQRHQNGDVPYGIGSGPYSGLRDTAWDDYVRCHVRTDYSYWPCASVPSTPPEKLDDPNGDFLIRPRALQITDHKRRGVELSNRFKLNSSLNLTLAGNFTHEKLAQWDASEGQQLYELTWGVNHMGPRAGTREEQNYSFNFEWAPTSWLQLYAGARYSDYWSYDDRLAEQRSKHATNWDEKAPITALRYSYQVLLSDAEAAAIDEGLRQEYQLLMEEFADFPEILESMLAEFPTADAYANADKINGVRYSTSTANTIDIPYNGTHEGFAASNPFQNGTLDPNEQVQDAQGTSGSVAKYVIGYKGVVQGTAPADRWQKPEKKKGHAWAPQFGATVFLTDSARIYARYAEFVRFPSVFEATQAAYGSYGGQVGNAASKPEHAYNWEIGYVQNLADWLPGLELADLRINYFDNRIDDYIDRDYNFNIVQFARKKTTGIEFQARADSGRYFANFGATYRLKQEMCDKDYAAYMDPVYGRFPECTTGGFPRTFARTAIQPKYSLNLDVGARLLGRKLEIGGRAVYHSEAEGDDDKYGQTSMEFNRTYYWNPILVFDAYATYRVTRALSIDFGISNITNEYYLDPMARVSVPAPGRTAKLGLTFRL